MKHLAAIQRDFLKLAGFSGLSEWGESDTAADFVVSLISAVKKNKDINALVSKEIADEGNQWNTSGAVNVALAMEAEGKDTGDEEDNVPQFSHLLNQENFDKLKAKLKEVIGAAYKKDVKHYKRMLKHVLKKQLARGKQPEQKPIKRGPRGGKFYESGDRKKVYVDKYKPR